jgi:hypothetical protein
MRRARGGKGHSDEAGLLASNHGMATRLSNHGMVAPVSGRVVRAGWALVAGMVAPIGGLVGGREGREGRAPSLSFPYSSPFSLGLPPSRSPFPPRSTHPRNMHMMTASRPRCVMGCHPRAVRPTHAADHAKVGCIMLRLGGGPCYGSMDTPRPARGFPTRHRRRTAPQHAMLCLRNGLCSALLRMPCSASKARIWRMVGRPARGRACPPYGAPGAPYGAPGAPFRLG